MPAASKSNIHGNIHGKSQVQAVHTGGFEEIVIKGSPDLDSSPITNVESGLNISDFPIVINTTMLCFKESRIV